MDHNKTGAESRLRGEVRDVERQHVGHPVDVADRYERLNVDFATAMV